MLATYTSKGYIKKKFEFYLNFEGTTVKKKPVVYDKKKKMSSKAMRHTN